MLSFVQWATASNFPGFSHIAGGGSAGNSYGLTEWQLGFQGSTHFTAHSTNPGASGSTDNYSTSCQTSYSQSNGQSDSAGTAVVTGSGSASGTFSGSTYSSYSVTETTGTLTASVSTTVSSSRSIYTGTTTTITGTGTGRPTTTTASQTYNRLVQTSGTHTYTYVTATSYTFSDGTNSYMRQTVVIPESNVKTNDWLWLCIPNTDITEWIDETWLLTDVFFSTDGPYSIDHITGEEAQVIGYIQTGSAYVQPVSTGTRTISTSRTATRVTFATLTATSTFYFEDMLPMEGDTYTTVYSSATTDTRDTTIVSTTRTTSTSTDSSVVLTVTTATISESVLSTISFTFYADSVITTWRGGTATNISEFDNLYVWSVSGGGVSTSFFTTSYAQVNGWSTVTTSGSVYLVPTSQTEQKTVTVTKGLTTGWEMLSPPHAVSSMHSVFAGPAYMIQPNVSFGTNVYAAVSADVSMPYPGKITTSSGTSTGTVDGLFMKAAIGETTDNFYSAIGGVRIPFQQIYAQGQTWQTNTRWSSFLNGDDTWRISWGTDSMSNSSTTWIPWGVITVTFSQRTGTRFTTINSVATTVPLAAISTFTNSLSPIGSQSPVIKCGVGRNSFFSIDTIVKTTIAGDRNTTIGGTPHASSTESAMLSGNFAFTNTDASGTTSYLDYPFGPAAVTTTIDSTGAAVSVFRSFIHVGFSVDTATFTSFIQGGIIWLFQKHEQDGNNLSFPFYVA